MCRKIGFVNIGFTAIIAHVWLFTGMNHLMLIKTEFVSERFVTDDTDERFVPAVRNNMPLQIATRRKRLKGFVTDGTTERFVPGVCSNMSLQ